VFIVFALFTCGLFLVTIIALVVARLRLRRLTRSATRQASAWDGSSLSVAEQVWALRAVTDLPSAESVARSGAKTPELISACATINKFMSKDQREVMAGRIEIIAKARAERERLHVLIPAVQRAAYYTTPVFDLVLQEMLSSANRQVGHSVLDSLHSAIPDHATVLGDTRRPLGPSMSALHWRMSPFLRSQRPSTGKGAPSKPAWTWKPP